MNTVGATVAILAGLVVLAGFIVAVLVNARAKGQEETTKRLRDDRDDYKSRVEFIEPRLSKVLEENAMLQQMHDPTAQLTAIKGDTGMIVALLKAQQVDIQEALNKAGGEDG